MLVARADGRPPARQRALIEELADPASSGGGGAGRQTGQSADRLRLAREKGSARAISTSNA